VATKSVNHRLICALCQGYFCNAHTIGECLHTCTNGTNRQQNAKKKEKKKFYFYFLFWFAVCVCDTQHRAVRLLGDLRL
jgi:hypothetical protein